MKNFNDNEIKQIIELYVMEKFSLSKIGDEFNVSKKVISRILKENSITLRDSGRPFNGGKSASNKRYREKDSNKEKQQLYMVTYTPKYYEENKDKKSVYYKEYREKNVDSERNRHKKYYQENKDKIKKYREQYKNRRNMSHKQKMSSDSLYKLKHNIRTLIKQTFKIYTKKSKTQEILGCSFEEFKEHIESKWEDWMNWDNHGNPKDGVIEENKTWDLDHIIPLSTAKTEEEIIKLNHYTNLQPLCSYYNRFIKKDKI